MKAKYLKMLTLLLLGVAISSFKIKEITKNSKSSNPPKTNKLVLEKSKIKLGFIKLTDMAPLAIALKLGYFSDEGLDVTLEAQANWTEVLNKVLDDQLDGSHMLAGQPIAAAVGAGRRGELVTSFCMDLNGNGITVSNEIWGLMKDSIPYEYGKPAHPIPAKALMPAINFYKKNNLPFTLGVVAHHSNHNYQLRYWLAASGINPGIYDFSNMQGYKGTVGGDIKLEVIAPPQMPSSLTAKVINGYCVGEPWNQQAITDGVGVPIIISRDIWKNHPEKLFVMTKMFVEKYPNTAIAITKALIRAGKWLDDLENRKQAAGIIAKSEYLDYDKKVIDNSMIGTFEYEKGDVRDAPDFNVFFKYDATYPFYSDGIWFLTQMRRWGQITETKPDAWYHDKIKEVYKPEIWLKAAKLLQEEGFLAANEIPQTDGYKPETKSFIDYKSYDGKKPVEYINSFKIGLK